MNVLKKVLSVVLISLIIPAWLFSGCSSGAAWNEVLDFVIETESSGDFKILQLTDIQIIDSSQCRTPDRLYENAKKLWAPDKMEVRAWRFIRDTVNQTNPDLIVLTGDNIYGEFDDAGTSLTALIEFMDSFKIPWTFTFGNHDNETYKGIEWTTEQYLSSEYCIFKRGDIENVDGNGNFNIGILQDGKLTEVLWLMDSNGHTYGDKDQNISSAKDITDSQYEWFTAQNERIKENNGGVSPKAIGFFHHPVRAVGDAMQQYGYVSAAHDFLDENGDYVSFKSVTVPENEKGDFGFMRIDPAYYLDSQYLFHDALIEYNFEGWFFGHEHENGCSAVFEGIRYTFGVKSSQYDSYPLNKLGGTVILIGENGLRVSPYYSNLPDDAD